MAEAAIMEATQYLTVRLNDEAFATDITNVIDKKFSDNEPASVQQGQDAVSPALKNASEH